LCLQVTLGLAAVLVFRVTSAGTNAEQRTEAQDMYKSSIEKVKPGLPMISERNHEFLSVSQRRSKPLVGGIYFQPASKGQLGTFLNKTPLNQLENRVNKLRV